MAWNGPGKASTLGVMAATTPPRRRTSDAASPGAAIAARRRALDLTSEDITALTKGVINQKLLSRLENDHFIVSQLRVTKLTALLGALRWTVRDLEEATGVTLDQGLPGAETYAPSFRIPILGTISAGLRDVEESMGNPADYITVDAHVDELRGRPNSALVALRVTGDSMVSESVAKSIPAGARVIVEIGAIPSDNDVVAAWLPEHGTAVLKRWREDGAVLRSLNPLGPVFRALDTQIDVRGVVRLVQFRP